MSFAGLTLLLIVGLAILLLLRVFESQHPEQTWPQHRLLRIIGWQMIYVGGFGFLLFLATSPLIVLLPPILSLLLAGLLVERRVAEVRFVSLLRHSTKYAISKAALAQAFVQATSRPYRKIRRTVKRLEANDELSIAIKRAKLELSLNVYLETIPATISPKTSESNEHVASDLSSGTAKQAFIRMLTYLCVIGFIVLMIGLLLQAAVWPVLDSMAYDYNESTITSNTPSPTLGSTSQAILKGATTTWGGRITLITQGLLISCLGLAAFIRLVCSNKLWSVRTLGANIVFGKQRLSTTLHFVASRLSAGESFPTILEQHSIHHPFSKLRKQARTLLETEPTNRIEKLKHFGWIDAKQSIENSDAIETLTHELATAFKSRSRQLAEAQDKFWDSNTRRLQFFGTLIVGVYVAWMCISVFRPLCDLVMKLSV
jgi:hypothetical protein